jgi:hypothetical protein
MERATNELNALGSEFYFASSHTKTKSMYKKTLGNSKFVNDLTFSFSLLALMCNLSLRIEGFLFCETFHLFCIFFILKFLFFLHTRIKPKINHFSLNGEKEKIVEVFF